VVIYTSFRRPTLTKKLNHLRFIKTDLILCTSVSPLKKYSTCVHATTPCAAQFFSGKSREAKLDLIDRYVGQPFEFTWFD
jgi:hypothetical protein